MNGSKDNNEQRAWKAIYAQWDRERLEEELVRNADQLREIRNERNQLQSRVRQLEEENRVQAAELRRLNITNQVFAEAVVALKDQGMQGGREGESAAEAASAEPEPESPRQKQRSVPCVAGGGHVPRSNPQSGLQRGGAACRTGDRTRDGTTGGTARRATSELVREDTGFC